ncbi:MAG: hypothetical protein ACYDC2_01180 [Solirubrobacteraceae bacterium]
MRMRPRARALLLAAIASAAWAGVAAATATSASATPTVTLKALPLPLPGHPDTGYILGHGAALQAEYRISGHEYGGFPPPLIGVSFFLPAGTQLHPEAFATCPRATLEPSGPGPSHCPKTSLAGSGTATGVVAFGSSIVPETTTISAFFAPGGGLEFFTFGHEPVLLEILSSAKYVSYDREGFGQELISQIPLVETVPGAQDASVERIQVTVGALASKNGKSVFYGVLPSHCPAQGFTVRSELTFAGLGGLTQTTVPVVYKAPCPRR